MFWSENPAFSPDTHILVLLFASLRTGLEAPWVASSRLCHQWGHQEGDKIYQRGELGTLELDGQRGSDSLPMPRRQCTPQALRTRIAHACSTASAKTTLQKYNSFDTW